MDERWTYGRAAMTLVSTMAACVAAIAAAVGLVFARAAVLEARKTVVAAEDARRDAEADRRRHRLEALAELVERIFFSAYSEREPPYVFREALNLLPARLTGLSDPVPRCRELADLGDRNAVMAKSGEARHELRTLLGG